VVCDILGKKVIDGDAYYLVDWRPTLEPEHALGHAKAVVDEFEARLRAQLASKSGRGAPGLKQGEPVTIRTDAPGRDCKSDRGAGPGSNREA
jgi:hypothetical protein